MHWIGMYMVVYLQDIAMTMYHHHIYTLGWTVLVTGVLHYLCSVDRNVAELGQTRSGGVHGNWDLGRKNDVLKIHALFGGKGNLALHQCPLDRSHAQVQYANEGPRLFLLRVCNYDQTSIFTIITNFSTKGDLSPLGAAENCYGSSRRKVIVSIKLL